MAKISVTNNGCAEMAYAYGNGSILVVPGTNTLEVPDDVVKPFIAAMKRRAPHVFVKVLIDAPVKKAEPKPKPEKKAEKKAKIESGGKK